MSNKINDFDGFLLDLDGTLTDSKRGIFNCIHHALDCFGVEIPDEKFLNNLIGPPLTDSFCRYFGFDEATAKAALIKYRERYEKLGIFELELYPNVKKTLKTLKESGKIIALATSKVDIYAKMILQRLDIEQYFHHVQGGDMAGKLCGKSDVVRLCLNALNERFGVDKSRCVMVGDRKYDVIGAKDNKIRCIGVTYGYAEEGELADHGVDFLIDDIAKLL